MKTKILFLLYLFTDLYFVISGLSLIKTFGETVTAFAFLLLIWFIFWSIYKIFLLISEKPNMSFLRYYFSFLISVKNRILKEKGLGQSKFFRGTLASLSLFSGIFALSSVVYFNISETTFTKELILRQIEIISKIVVFPFTLIVLNSLMTGQKLLYVAKKITTFFMFRFVYLFLWIFTFLTPVGYFFMAFMSFISAKSMIMKIDNKQ